MEFKNIELYFLNSILRISIIGVSLILISNIIFYPSDLISISIEIAILLACVLAYFLRHKYAIASVLLVTSITIAAVSYQKWMSPIATAGIPTLLIIGFIVSVMLKGKTMWIMHGISMLLLILVFAPPDIEPITSSVTYLTIYFVLVFGAYKIKSAYDDFKRNLMDANEVLQKQTVRMESQYRELQITQKELNELNKELEQRVNERTSRIKDQNQILIRYAYTNAHHLRGPVARLMGLASVYRLDSNEDAEEIIDMMAQEAKEIDTVIKQINVDLAEKNLENLD
ncbi:MAG: hypothetical protein RLN79_03755 [Cytophagales bacterium]